MNFIRFSVCFIFILLLSIPGYAQKSKKSDDINLFSIADPDFDGTEVPEKWKGESAVVLCQKIYLSYQRKAGGILSGPNLEVDGSLRRRVKLQDKAALEEFSEFYFRSSDASGFQVVKPDGKVIPIDMAQAVEVKTEVPQFYRSYYYSSKYYKLAIPGLEIGDVIDYYYLFHEDDDSYAPVITTLAKDYPIMHQEMKFNVDKGFYVSFNSYNGAPEIVKTGNGVDHKGRERKDAWAFVMTDRDREKYKTELWDFEFLSEATIKFQVYFMTNADKDDTPQFVGNPGEVKSSVTQRDLFQHLSNSGGFLPYGISGYIKSNKINNKSEEDILETAYYYARAKLLHLYYYHGRDAYGYPLKIDQFNFEKDPYVSVASMYFVNTMVSVLEKYGIGAEIVVGIPRKFGSLDDLLLASELQYGVFVESMKKIIFPFDNFSHPYESNHLLESTSAYIIKPGKTESDYQIRKINISASTWEDNQHISKLSVNLSEDLQNLNVERKTIITGAQKANYTQVALYGHDYIKSEIAKYDIDNKTPTPLRGRKKTLEDLKARQTPAKKKQIEARDEIFEEMVADDFGETEYGKFKLLETGRTHKEPDLEYRETFTVKEMVNKAGKNIFSISGH